MTLGLAGKLKRARATLLVAAGLACTAPAQAAVYHGAWDPAFGSAFPDLGWRGEATFLVPDACLAKSGWVSNFEPCSNSGMKILSAEVEFYQLSDPANPTLETLFFNVPSSFVTSMTIEDGMLAGVDGSFDYLVLSTLPLAGPYTSFVLFFLGDRAGMGFTDGQEIRGVSDPNLAPIITFRVVPEPGSLALAALAMLLLVPSLRSRNETPADRAGSASA